MSLAPGTQLASYEVLALIGAGGMGEVYRALDSRLKREVALKVLPQAFVGDAHRMARFEREAELLASLNHPNIASIYGLEESNSIRFLVLELVPGETLAEILKRGALPVKEALELAAQIADALTAAHDRGVIHRDLKPANIKITPEEQVKVLDFGLAKALLDDPIDADLSASPTLSAHATRAGVILGTAAYMSPEQARGRAVDKRTDIFSFGAVLYEMLAGRQLFAGEDIADTMASVIKSDPDFRGLPAGVPPRLREILARCLEKDPKKRRRDIGDIRAELEAPEQVSAETPKAPSRLPLAAAVGAALALSMVTGVSVWNLKPEPPQSVRRFDIVVEGELFSGGGRHLVALSRQGTHLVYAADQQLWLRSLEEETSVPIRGTEGGREPFFSPDGAWIGFWADWNLKKIAMTGGAPVTLCEAETPSGASWSEDDTIVFSQGPAGIFEVSANGGEPRVLVESGQVPARGPQKLPGAKALLFTLSEGARNWDEARIVVRRLDSGETKTLIRGGTDARYLPTGHLVYALGGALFAVPFDLGRLEVTGGPVSVVEGVSQADTGAAHFTVSEDGLLAFVAGRVNVERSLLWVDRDGRTAPLTERKRGFSRPRFSPDGKRVALWLQEGAGESIWLHDIARDTLTQLASGRSAEWSPDGAWLVFSGPGEQGLDLYRIRSDFSNPPELVVQREGDQYGWFTPDGKAVVFQTGTQGSGDIWQLPLEENVEPRSILQVPANASQPGLSPDGRFLVYQSNLSGGMFQIFVEPFPGPGERTQVSTDGGWNPKWSPSGRELFFEDIARERLMAVTIETEPELEVGPPETLFEWSSLGGFGPRSWDVAPDGDRFVFVSSDSSDDRGLRVKFVVHWFEELRRRME